MSLAATFGLPARAAAAQPLLTPKVAIIVGPVGSLTPTYLHLAELAAAAAERGGATVARAYSPNATPANVLAAVEGAHVVVYFGHGYGHPSPYGGLDTSRQNGWGLQGPGARGTHGDAIGSELAYYGEDWIVANARPAPGFVMIYSNTCYAPGASEGGFAPATPEVAAERVAHYSRKVFTMGGSAYYAVDFDAGAADLVGRILAERRSTYGALFAGDHRYAPWALTTQAHPFSAGQQIWLHRTKYTDGPPNYWYAFAGNPDAVPARSWDPVPPTATLASSATDAPADAPIELRLSEPVSGLSPAQVRLVDGDGATVAASVTVAADGTAVQLRPAQALEMGARYRLTLAGGAADAAGNPLAGMATDLVTRLDADPLVRDLPVRLRAGVHRLVRFDATWRPIEERDLELDGEQAVAASRRARLPDADGSWLELRGADLDGWWVAESPAAFVVGTAAHAELEPVAVGLLRPDATGVTSLSDGTVAIDHGVRLPADRRVALDAVVVIDGRRLFRLAEAADGERQWIGADQLEADPASAASERRILWRAARSEPAELGLRSGDWILFRLDDAGRVLERRTLPAGEAPTLAAGATLDLGGARFFVVDGGPLGGWVVREDARVEVSSPGVEVDDPA